MAMSNYVVWVIRLIVAGILLQTLYFKFSGHPDSVYIFEQTGLGSTGRIGIGILELISAILILIPKFSAFGALSSLGIISGAIFFHLTKLGVEVHGDGGTLFFLAIAVFVGSVALLILHRQQILQIIKKFTAK